MKILLNPYAKILLEVVRVNGFVFDTDVVVNVKIQKFFYSKCLLVFWKKTFKGKFEMNLKMELSPNTIIRIKNHHWKYLIL